MQERLRVRRMALGSKITLLMVGVSLLSALAVGGISYAMMANAQMRQVKASLVSLAQAGALLVDGDAHARLRPGDEDSQVYRATRARLRDFQRRAGVACAYTLAPGGRAGSRFVVDAAEADAAPIGYEYQVLPAMATAFAGTACTDAEPLTDEWGTFLSGYAPVKDSTGA
ncbi:MAG: hypothetical protein NUV35_02780, partial [Syntrophomonadaceae bacterium]|nr:hypothetical protein [Syntrophomonadaceae bacterium]